MKENYPFLQHFRGKARKKKSSFIDVNVNGFAGVKRLTEFDVAQNREALS